MISKISLCFQWMLGHADLTTTQRYITNDPELLRSLVENGPVDTKRTQLSLPGPDVFAEAERQTALSSRFTEDGLPKRR